MKEKEKYRKEKCELSKLKDYAPGNNNKAKKTRQSREERNGKRWMWYNKEEWKKKIKKH